MRENSKKIIFIQIIFFVDTQGAYKLLINMLDNIGIRGFLTIIGVRITPGSCENILPKRDELYKSFNLLYKVKI